MNILFLTFLSFIVTLFSLKKSIPLLRKNLIDNPNFRSLHSIPKPSGGGLFFVIYGSFFSFLSGNLIPIICAPIAFVGLLDDLYHLSRSIRYFSQLIITSVLILLIDFNNLFFSEIFFLNIFFIFSGIFFGTAIINFTNFMDGIDGLVAGNLFIIILSTSYLNSFSILPLAGAILGFLFFNWYPSKVFMGDTGSTYLGLVLTALLFSSQNLLDFFSLMLISAPLLLDAFTCVIRRFVSGQNIFKPHKVHLYQRLIQSGWSHAKVSFVYICGTIFLSLINFIFGFEVLCFFTLLILSIGIYLDNFIAKPFN